MSFSEQGIKKSLVHKVSILKEKHPRYTKETN